MNFGRLIQHISCVLFVLIGGGWFFLIELFDYYWTIDPHRDMFYWSALFITVSWLAILVTAVCLFVRLIRRTADGVLACQFLFIIFAVASNWFRYDLMSAADRTFLWLNEDKFRAISQADPDNAHAAVILHRISIYNLHKILIHVGFRTIDNGGMSLDTLDSLGSGLDAFRGCRVSAERLKDDFYLLEINS